MIPTNLAMPLDMPQKTGLQTCAGEEWKQGMKKDLIIYFVISRLISDYFSDLFKCFT